MPAPHSSEVRRIYRSRLLVVPRIGGTLREWERSYEQAVTSRADDSHVRSAVVGTPIDQSRSCTPVLR